MLRDFDWLEAEPAEFCAKCHGKIGSRSAQSMHWLALGVAHISGDGGDVRAGGRVLDAHTQQCLSCHDGVIAAESKNATPWTGSQWDFSDSRRNHPVGVRYDHLSRPEVLTPLRPAAMLPQAITLPDGKVACVSCHDLYAGAQNLLTVPIEGSELCLTCHDIR
jgi:predicted CXXCH cytochrome family protein